MSFATANAIRGIRPWWMISIEGIRKRRATFQPSWNPANTGVNRYIDLLLSEPPRIGGQEVDPLNGTCIVASHSFGLHDVAAEITALLAVSDTPKAKSFLTATVPKEDETHIAVDDFSDFDAAGDIFIDRETVHYAAKTTRTDSGTGDELTGQTADADTAATKVYDAARTEVDDYWLGALLTFTSGSNNGESRRVVRFIKSSDQFLDPWADGDEADNTIYTEPDNPFSNGVTTGDQYTLHFPPNRLKDVALAGTGTDDYWLGARVFITADTDYPANVGELRWVKSWEKANDVLEFYEPLPGPTGATTQYAITLYAFTGITRSLYQSEAAEHSVLDSKGEPIPVDVVDALPFMKSRKVWINENREGEAEDQAKEHVGVIDNYTLDPSGQVFRFECSGIMKLAGNKLMTKQLRAKVTKKPVWGGRFRFSRRVEDGEVRYWPTMSDAEVTEYSVTEIFFESSNNFPADGANVKIGEEILRYKERGLYSDIRDGARR